LRVISLLPGLGWVMGFHIVPCSLRDMIYRLIARTRYRVWGRHTACDLGDRSHADRVVTALIPR
jgi:predicted DCC family thiol-disulfide oxidoreductase YuxK